MIQLHRRSNLNPHSTFSLPLNTLSFHEKVEFNLVEHQSETHFAEVASELGAR